MLALLYSHVHVHISIDFSQSILYSSSIDSNKNTP